ncbi:unnamed protein product [Chrysoparadoxa australica]
MFQEVGHLSEHDPGAAGRGREMARSLQISSSTIPGAVDESPMSSPEGSPTTVCAVAPNKVKKIGRGVQREMSESKKTPPPLPPRPAGDATPPKHRPSLLSRQRSETPKSNRRSLSLDRVFSIVREAENPPVKRNSFMSTDETATRTNSRRLKTPSFLKTGPLKRVSSRGSNVSVSKTETNPLDQWVAGIKATPQEPVLSPTFSTLVFNQKNPSREINHRSQGSGSDTSTEVMSPLGSPDQLVQPKQSQHLSRISSESQQEVPTPPTSRPVSLSKRVGKLLRGGGHDSGDLSAQDHRTASSQESDMSNLMLHTPEKPKRTKMMPFGWGGNTSDVKLDVGQLEGEDLNAAIDALSMALEAADMDGGSPHIARSASASPGTFNGGAGAQTPEPMLSPAPAETFQQKAAKRRSRFITLPSQEKEEEVPQLDFGLALAHPRVSKKVRAFAKRRFCAENVEFLEAVNAFDWLPEGHSKKITTQLICHDYIVEDSRWELNISDKCRQETLKLAADDDPSCFEEAVLEVQNMVITGTWTEFINSQEYAELLDEEGVMSSSELVDEILRQAAQVEANEAKAAAASGSVIRVPKPRSSPTASGSPGTPNSRRVMAAFPSSPTTRGDNERGRGKEAPSLKERARKIILPPRSSSAEPGTKTRSRVASVLSSTFHSAAGPKSESMVSGSGGMSSTFNSTTGGVVNLGVRGSFSSQKGRRDSDKSRGGDSENGSPGRNRFSNRFRLPKSPVL